MIGWYRRCMLLDSPTIGAIRVARQPILPAKIHACAPSIDQLHRLSRRRGRRIRFPAASRRAENPFLAVNLETAIKAYTRVLISRGSISAAISARRGLLMIANAMPLLAQPRVDPRLGWRGQDLVTGHQCSNHRRPTPTPRDLWSDGDRGRYLMTILPPA